ncbi:microtubule-associated protein futsch-like [Palaemon carinicauda]|uniref:microtubule-associated protein futsch-like n=1 Tax=Palaemon carinicauda TaxID=392227 RepID=UPI0035B68478
MLSVCGLLCRMLRGWRHSEAVMLMAKALSQPQSTLLIQNVVDSSSGSVTVNEPNSTSAFCQNSSEGTVGQMLWRDNNKQAVIIIPRQQVDLKRWTLFLASSFSPHNKSVPSSTDENNEQNGGSSDVSGAVTILLEASFRDQEADMEVDHHVMVEHLSQPYAWKARDTFGVIVTATPPQLLAMVQAFFNNALLMDDDFVITKILTVDLVGEPSTLDDPLSIPESVTPGPYAERSGLTQLELARSLPLSGFTVHQLPAIAAKDLEARSNSLHPPSLSNSLRHQSSENSTDTSTTLNPQSSSDSDKLVSSLDPQSSYDSVSDYPTSDTDDVPCNVYNFYPRGWAISGSHVISGQPLSVRGVLNQLEGKQYKKPCSIVTNPMEDLWNDPDDSSKRRGSSCTLYSLQRSSCLNGPSAKQDDRTSLLKGDVIGPECLPRYTCLSGSVICKGLQAEPGRAERQIVREAAEHYRRAITSSQERRSWTMKRSYGSSGEEDNVGASSQHSFSGSNTIEKSVVTREPKRYPVRIKSEADLSRATSLIKDNLANIVENYLVKQSGSPDFQYQFPKVQMENPTLKLPRPLCPIEPVVYMNGRATEIRNHDEVVQEEPPSSVVPIVITEIKTPTRDEAEEPSESGEFGELKSQEDKSNEKITDVSGECGPIKVCESVQKGSIFVTIPPQKILPRVSSDPEEPFTVRGNKFKLKVVDANIPGVHGIKPKEVSKATGKIVRKLVKSDELSLPTMKREGRIDIPVGFSMEVDLNSLSKEVIPKDLGLKEVPKVKESVVDVSGIPTVPEKVTDQAKVPAQIVTTGQMTDEAGGITEKGKTCEKVTDRIGIAKRVITPDEVKEHFDISGKNLPSSLTNDTKPSVTATAKLSEGEYLSDKKEPNGTILNSQVLICDETILPNKTLQETDEICVSKDNISGKVDADNLGAEIIKDEIPGKVDTVSDLGSDVISSGNGLKGSIGQESQSPAIENDSYTLPDKKCNGVLLSEEVCTDTFTAVESKPRQNTFAGISIILEEKAMDQENKVEEATNERSNNSTFDADEGGLGEFLEGNNNRGRKKPKCLKDTHKLDTKSSTASESSFESLPYRMLSSQPDSFTDDVVIELTRAPIDSERLRVAKQELMRLERMNAISMASQYMTESKDDFSPEENGLENKVTCEDVILDLNVIGCTEQEDTNLDLFNSSLFDSGVEGMQSDQNTSGGSSIAKVLPSPVESTTESGFSSLKEQLPNESLAPEEEKYGGHDGVSLSKSKDSLDFTDTDRFPGTDTLSDDMETLSSAAGDLTLVESGSVSKEGSSRGSMSDSINQEGGFIKILASEQAGVTPDSSGIPNNYQSTSYHAPCDMRIRYRSGSYSQKSSMDSSSLSTEIPENKSKNIEDVEESSQTVSVSGEDKSKCFSEEGNESKSKTSESLSSEDTVVSRVSLEEQAGKTLHQGSQGDQLDSLDGQMQVIPIEERDINVADGGISLTKTTEKIPELNMKSMDESKAKSSVVSAMRPAFVPDSIVTFDAAQKSKVSEGQVEEKSELSEELVLVAKGCKSSSFGVTGQQGKQSSVADLIEMYDSKDTSLRERSLSSGSSKTAVNAVVKHQGVAISSKRPNGIKSETEEMVYSADVHHNGNIDSPKIVEPPTPIVNGSVSRRSDAARKSDVSDQSSPYNRGTCSTSDRPSRHSSKSGVSDLEDEVFLPPSENYIFDGRPVIYCPKIDMSKQVKVEPPKMAMSVFTVVPSKELGSSQSKDWRDLSTMGALPSMKDFYAQATEDANPPGDVGTSDTSSSLSNESARERHSESLFSPEKLESEEGESKEEGSLKPQGVVDSEPVAKEVEVETSASLTEEKSPSGSQDKSYVIDSSPQTKRTTLSDSQDILCKKDLSPKTEKKSASCSQDRSYRKKSSSPTERKSISGNQDDYCKEDLSPKTEKKSVSGSQDKLYKKELSPQTDKGSSLSDSQDKLCKKESSPQTDKGSVSGSQDKLCKKEASPQTDKGSLSGSQDKLCKKESSPKQEKKSLSDSQDKLCKIDSSPLQVDRRKEEIKTVQVVKPLVKDVTFKSTKQGTSSPTNTGIEGIKVRGKQKDGDVTETSTKIQREDIPVAESSTLKRTSSFKSAVKNDLTHQGSTDTIPVVTLAKQPILSPVLQSAISPRSTYDPFTGTIIDSETPDSQGDSVVQQEKDITISSEGEGAQQVKPKLFRAPNLDRKDTEVVDDGTTIKEALPVKKVEIKILDNADSRPRELPVLSPVSELQKEKHSKPPGISDEETSRVIDTEECSGQKGDCKDSEKRNSGRKEELATHDRESRREGKHISGSQNGAGIVVKIDSRTSEESDPEKVHNQSSVESCESAISVKSDTRRPSKAHSEQGVSSLKNSGWCVGGSLEFLEKHSGEVRLRSRKDGSISSAKSEDLSMKCDKASLKSQGSLDKFPHFDHVSAQQRARGARKKILSVDIDSGVKGIKEKNKEMHRSATLPVGTLSSSRKEKEEKKKEKEDKSKKKKKEKEASGGTEKKSTIMSLKGLLKRSKTKDKDKEKDSSSQEKLSSPSLFRKFDRKSRSNTQSPSLDDPKHGEKGNVPDSPNRDVEKTRSSPISSNGKTRPVISSPVSVRQVSKPVDVGVAKTLRRSSAALGTSGSDSESPAGSLQSSPKRIISHPRKASLGNQPSPRLYRHVLTRHLSSSQESVDNPLLSSTHSSPQSSPHTSPKRTKMPASASSYSLPASRDMSPPAPVMGTRALRGSSNSFSVTIGFKPTVEKRNRTMSEGADLNKTSLSPAKRKEGSRILTQLNKRSSSMEILVCGKIREHCSDGGKSPGGSPFSREGSFRLHREISVETLFELPETSPRSSRTQKDYQEYLEEIHAQNDSHHGSSCSLFEDSEIDRHSEYFHRRSSHHSPAGKKLSLPHNMHLSGLREIATSNPNLQRTGSPFVRGIPHSSSFTSSPFRRPHSSAAVFSPAKRGLTSTPGVPPPLDGTPGSQLMRVEEEGPCRKNLDNETEKPPNVLIYAANKMDYFVAIKETLKNCLNQDRYTLYQLTDEMAFKSPWSGSTTLLVVCGDVPAHISTAFIRYLLQGGRVLSICSDFLNMAVPLFAFELPWTSSLVASGTVEVQEQAVVSVSYHQWSGVQLLHHQHCFHSSPQHKRFSREVDKTKSIPSRSAVSVEPTHVEITDEWGGRHRLNLTILATDDTWGAPSLLSAKLQGNKGKAVFSQVHLERDPRECFGASELSAKLSSSNEARLEILKDLLSTELSMDTTQTNVASLYTAAYALGRHELKQELLNHLKPHMEGQELKRPQLTIQFLSSGETSQKPDEHILPIYMNSCPMTFSTVKYFEALKTTSVGRLLIYCDVLTSSMRVTAGHPPLLNGLVVLPSQQTLGKGRGGNTWLSPLGCAMFTIQLHVTLSSTLGQHLSFIQHLIAIAMADAVREQPGYGDIPVCLKWPNDIYIGRDIKIGGVIVEASTLGNVVIANIGCGVNLSNSNPTYCINDAIRQHNKDNDDNLPELEREVFFARTFNAFEQLVEVFQKSGPEAVVQKYYKYWLHSNATVIVQNENFKSESAVITGVDNFGFLEAQLISGASITLHPDGNSFNMMEGLIYSKCR